VDIFEKEVLVVPINQGLHWSLALVLNPGRTQEWQARMEEKAQAAAAAAAPTQRP
jgi:Ulp1 family protease